MFGRKIRKLIDFYCQNVLEKQQNLEGKVEEVGSTLEINYAELSSQIEDLQHYIKSLEREFNGTQAVLYKLLNKLNLHLTVDNKTKDTK